MNFHIVATCGTSSCPTIYAADADGEDVIVQGYVQELTTPEGEQAVRIPRQLLLEAAEKLARPAD